MLVCLMKKFPLILIWLATIWSAAWFGGQLFNALMVVPHFSRHPPESLVAWGQMRFDNLADFFVIFAPLWTFLALLVAFFMARRSPARIWLLIAASAALVCLFILLGWMVPTIVRLVQPDHGGLDAAGIARELHRWTIMNWVRLGIDFLIFASATRALTLWSAQEPRG
jgi:hypothetical protein